MKSTKGFKIGLWIGAVVGVFVLIWTIFLSVDYSSKKSNGVEVQATIEQIEYTRRTRKGIVSKYGTASYTDTNGSIHYFNGFLGNYVNVGDKISVIYEKDNPDSVVRENEALTWMPWLAVGIIVFCGGGALLLTFFGVGKKSVHCAHQNVPPAELARVINEYMPQTRQKFISERSKNKHTDKLGCDTVLQTMLDSGDSVKQIYDNYQTILSSDDIRLGAVVSVTDRDIYAEMKDIMSDDIDSGRARFTVPAIMVYGADDYFNSHPDELMAIADRLSGNSYGLNVSQHDSELINYVLNNNSRPFGMRYQSELTFGHNVILSTVILSKPALCNKKLCNKLLYLAVQGQYAAVIPAWYYSLWELSAF